MAAADEIRSFLETRLLALDPAIDLSSNSPAQIHVIEPVLARFSDDPFSTDIPSFIKDRLLQEFPELATDNGGMLDDILRKPFQLIFEPLKREIELVKIGQSVNNASVMSEEEADALGANWYKDRDQGSTSSGGVRLYYAAPSNARVTTDKRVFTASGLSFFPVQNFTLTSQEMLFNRQGSLYFLDIVVRAEKPGSEFNIKKGEIIAIDDVPNVIKISNLSDFIDGAPRETSEEYLGNLDQSLTERSLVTKRGVLARVPDLFTSVRALQIVGASDEGMNRDILTGTSEGFLHMAGQGAIYGNWLWAHTVIYKDDGLTNNIIPQVGDKVRFHEGGPSATTPATVEATIVSILTSTSEKYLFLLDETPYDSTSTIDGRFALFKPGYITISNIPGGISTGFRVPDNTVHLGGHTDVFVRPTEDSEVTSVLENVTDDSPLVALTDLQVLVVDDNQVFSSSTATSGGFDEFDVKVGDVLVIETGVGFAGSYRILQVDDPSDGKLRVDSIFDEVTSGSTVLRARIVRNIRVDLVSPKIPKLPFDTGSVSDLQTVVGSNEFQFASTDIQAFGAQVGDTINVLDGDDAGEYVIQSFPSLLGGQGAVVDRAVSASAAGLRFEVYTKLDGLTLPLVRLKSLEVLDSTSQGTGITVPYGDAVDIRTLCDLEGAGKEIKTLDDQLIVFPDLADIWPLSDDFVSVISETTDARYSQNLEIADGIVRTLDTHASNSIEEVEINLPPFLWNGKRDTLLALPTRKDIDFPSSITGSHRTSDLAKAHIGDSLTITSGPNQGQYIITDLRVLPLWGKTAASTGHHEIALVQVHPELKVDPLRAALNFMTDNGVTEMVAGGDSLAVELLGLIDWATEFDSASGFYKTFTDKLFTTLSSQGISFADAATLREFLAPMVRTGYSVGPSAKGDFRLYFQEPTSVELYFGDEPTEFISAAGDGKRFRVVPDLPAAQILPESEEYTPPSEWNRNLGIPFDQGDTVFLTSGAPFAKRGILPGDTIEFYRAVNDLPARKAMTSSWLGMTQTGSNMVQLIFPPTDSAWEQGAGGVDNFTDVLPGMLLFIDSGPDIGAYTITKVVEQTWSSNPASPPVVKVQVDKALTHTTSDYPDADHRDFAAFLPGYVRTASNSFPLTLVNKKVKFSLSADRGTTWPSSYEFTFPAGTYSDSDDVVAALEADSSFTALFTAIADGVRVAVLPAAPSARVAVRVDAPSSNTAYGDLQFTTGHIGLGIAGGATLPGTNKVYSSDFDFDLEEGDVWITLYAAQNADLLENDPDDTAIIGTYKVLDTGDDGAAYYGEQELWIELDRTDEFPADDPIEVRWVVLSTEPDTEPSNTDDGGREITDHYVRVRLYQSVSETLEVESIPWAAGASHPLLEDSDSQLTLESEVIDTASDQRNFSHMMPYRVLRPGILRMSSTTMATQREGALYYFDVPVVGYGPSEEMNVGASAGFLLDGAYKIEGYTLDVEDTNFSFSSDEQVSIVLPNAILPIGETPEASNQFNLAGQNIQVIYNNAPLVDDIQRFLESPLDRVAAANMLVRHFLPAYVFLDANYSGGSDVATVAKEIISHINNIDPDNNELRTDLIQDIIKRKGATKVDLPLTIIALVHGLDRRIRGMRSTKAIGIDDTPFFEGTFAQTYFIAGRDTSKESPRTNGEQIFLKRS